MPKNYLIIYSEQLATDIALLCQSIKAPSNTIFQIHLHRGRFYCDDLVLTFLLELDTLSVEVFSS